MIIRHNKCRDLIDVFKTLNFDKSDVKNRLDGHLGGHLGGQKTSKKQR